MYLYIYPGVDHRKKKKFPDLDFKKLKTEEKLYKKKIY